MEQKQSQNLAQKQKQTQRQWQIQKGVQYETPMFLDQLDEAEDEIDSDENKEDEQYEIDESDDFEDMSGDLESEDDSEFEHEETLEETIIELRHFPIAEIGIFNNEELVISTKDKKSQLLQLALQLIIAENKDFILRKTNKISKLPQKELVDKSSQDASLISRFLRNNYFSLPDGISYSLSTFFSDKTGKITKNENERELFLRSLISNEEDILRQKKKEGLKITEDMLFSDSMITEEFNKKFEKKNRKTIERLRKKLGIKSLNERLKDYLKVDFN